MDGVERFFKDGFAVGRSDIQQDAIHFRFYEDVFSVKDRSLKVVRHGDYLIAKLEDVRRLANG